MQDMLCTAVAGAGVLSNQVWVHEDAGWGVGDWLQLESRSTTQLARVDGFTAADSGKEEVCISRLLALTLGVVVDETVRARRLCEQGEVLPAADSVTFLAPFDLLDVGCELRAVPAKGSACRRHHTISALRGLLLHGAVISKGQAVAVEWFNKAQLLVAIGVGAEDPKRPHVITKATTVVIGTSSGPLNPRDWAQLGLHWVPAEPLPPTAQAWSDLACGRLGGMRHYVQQLVGRWWPILTTWPHLTHRRPPMGHCIMVHGAPGSGKSFLVEKILHFAPGVRIVRLNGSAVLQPTLNSSLGVVAKAFKVARQSQPSVLLIEELDALGGEVASLGSPGRGTRAATFIQARVVALLAREVDRLALRSSGMQMVVVGLTSRPDAVAQVRFAQHICAFAGGH